MAGFLYFVPGLDDASLPGLVARGLGHVFTTNGNAGMIRGPGPSGGRGLFVAPSGIPAPEVGYFAEEKRQVWRKMVGVDAWVGFEPARRPLPSDLARPTLLSGYDMTLGDGNRWTIPIGRYGDGTCALEQKLTLGDDGGWTPGGVLASQARIWEIALRVWDSYAAESGLPGAPATPLDEAEVSGLCVEVLAANYRVGRDEAAALGLLTSSNRQMILWAVADIPGFVKLASGRAAAEEKKAGAPEGAG
jgi:hypothetical protein